ncbi:MAG: 2-dehydropantoate 2-reductase [Alphaproteobacteria bacterium]|nr:2-dehydropantoate 2-reductase [Alphaproteobacteria bacterium]
MRIVAFGAGGVGGFFGGLLAKSGVDVTFIARGAHLDAIRTKGLCIRNAEGEIRIHPAQATDNVVTVYPPDFLLFAVKLFDTEAVAEACRPIVGPDTAVVSLQNGVEAVDILSGVFGRDRVMGGTVGVATVITEPGVITQTGLFNYMTFGEQDGSRSKRGLALEAACNAAGINATLSDDVDVDIWMKFVLLSAFSNMTALTRLPAGLLRETPETRAMLEACVAEAVAVGRAQDVALPADAIQQTVAKLDGLPAEMVASMLHDLSSGKPLELERLGGAVVRLGEAAGVPTPTQAFAYGALKPHITGT